MSPRRFAAVLASVVVAAGCARSPAPAADPAGLVERPRQAAPEGRAPAFTATTTGGEVIDSATLIGHRPFVLVFFTTWCPVCDVKMPIIREAAAAQGADVAMLLVSIDTEETWADVPAYLAHHGLTLPVIRGREHVAMARAYDPSGRIPFVMVVGRDGNVVDAQMGYRPDDRERLLAAIEIARRAPIARAP